MLQIWKSGLLLLWIYNRPSSVQELLSELTKKSWQHACAAGHILNQVQSAAMLETRSRSLPRLSSTRRLTHFIRHTLTWPRLTVKTCFCRLQEIQQALAKSLEARKSSKSWFLGQRQRLRAFSHQTFTMSVMIQMECSCIEKNTVSGIRLIGQKYQAN